MPIRKALNLVPLVCSHFTWNLYFLVRSSSDCWWRGLDTSVSCHNTSSLLTTETTRQTRCHGGLMHKVCSCVFDSHQREGSPGFDQEVDWAESPWSFESLVSPRLGSNRGGSIITINVWASQPVSGLYNIQYIIIKLLYILFMCMYVIYV